MINSQFERSFLHILQQKTINGYENKINNKIIYIYNFSFFWDASGHGTYYDQKFTMFVRLVNRYNWKTE